MGYDDSPWTPNVPRTAQHTVPYVRTVFRVQALSRFWVPYVRFMCVGLGLTANRRTHRYSMRSAFIGAMLAARFAGITAAKNEQTANEPAATTNASGSHHFTP